VSAKTVDHHVSALLAKLSVGSRLQAALAARELGIVAQNGEPSPQPSGSFRPWLIVEAVSAGRTVWAGGVGVLPTWPVWAWSAGRCVAVDVEQVGQALLGWAHLGEHAPGAGASLAAVVVEQHGFLDAGQLRQQLAY
jgi:hypothetical protein